MEPCITDVDITVIPMVNIHKTTLKLTCIYQTLLSKVTWTHDMGFRNQIQVDRSSVGDITAALQLPHFSHEGG